MTQTTDLKLHNNKSSIISVKEPILLSRNASETWALNPPLRYILNADQITPIFDYIETSSELSSSSSFNALSLNYDLNYKKILVERHRERGIGDLLFTTGPLEYIKHVSATSAQVYYYCLENKYPVLYGNNCLANKSPIVGPILYDNLKAYDFHWFINSVTEFTEELDQPNVYDTLYTQLGVDHKLISPRYKRPTFYLQDEDYKNLDTFYYSIFLTRKIDLRKQSYCVIAPFSNSNLRSAKYSMFLELIDNLKETMPVIISGANPDNKMILDMAPYEFMHKLEAMSSTHANVINLIGNISIRLVAAIVSKSKFLISLDSGILYIAEALRTPAISLWGTHDPKVRIGYDKDYMDLAIFKYESCCHAPCFSYHGFNDKKCPRKNLQVLCEPLAQIKVNEILDKIKTL